MPSVLRREEAVQGVTVAGWAAGLGKEAGTLTLSCFWEKKTEKQRPRASPFAR